MKTDHAAQCCFFTAEDACRIALQAYYAALKCIEPPPGEPWMIDGDPWAGPADLADAFHGQIEARLSLLALDRLGDFLLPVSQWDVVNVAAEIAPEKMAPIIADRARANAEIDAEFLGLGLNRLPPSDNVVHNQTERGGRKCDLSRPEISMNRRSVVILLLALLGLWGVRHALDHRRSTAMPGASVPDPGFCPRFGANPPQRLPVLRDIVSISFVSSRLVAVDRQGNVWTYFRGESNCDDPAPVKVLAADTARKLYPTAGLPRAVQRSSVLMDGQAIISLGLEFPDRCDAVNSKCLPSDTVGFGGIVALAAGDRHMLVARDDGSLWSSGMNDCGQLGREDDSAYADHFRQVPGMSNIVAVAAGMRSSMALDTGGVVFTWGNLSNPLFSSPTSPPVAGNPYCPYQDIEWAGHRLSGARDDYPREVASLPRIRQIATYYASDLALDSKGQVWGWGFNTCGQLGVNPGQGPDRIEYYIEHPRRIEGLPPIQAIASGKRHSLALDGDGRVWAWGENADSELGPRLDLSGSPACDNEYGRGDRAGFSAAPRIVPGIGKAVAIAAGYNSSAAIDENGDVWVWGRH